MKFCANYVFTCKYLVYMLSRNSLSLTEDRVTNGAMSPGAMSAGAMSPGVTEHTASPKTTNFAHQGH